MNIVVLAGGLSPERDVSLASGSLIANALMRTGNRVVLLDLLERVEIPKEGVDSLYFDKNSGKTYSYTVPEVEPDLDMLRERYQLGDAKIADGVLEVCKSADIVFLALHGDIGENGAIQALLDIYGIPYTGSGFEASLIAMNKELAKIFLRRANIKTPETFSFDHYELPLVVKPVDCGSSIGVSIVHSEEELEKALQSAKKYGEVMIEPYIKGREIQVGILDGVALPSIEILPHGGFYDYKNKYQKGVAKEVTPAPIPEEAERRVGEIALKVHQILNLGGYSRVDFIYDEEGEFWCLEANTLPGMTPTSLLPQEAKAVGIDYDNLCLKIASLAKGK
ncbi:D-alanine--D-alanine ligase family protein [Guggenheimella bovis]